MTSLAWKRPQQDEPNLQGTVESEAGEVSVRNKANLVTELGEGRQGTGAAGENSCTNKANLPIGTETSVRNKANLVGRWEGASVP
jgi:hypothetical protein